MHAFRRRALAALAALALTLTLAPTADADPARSVRVAVKNLSCAMCAGKIRKALLSEPGVGAVDASVPDQRFTLAVQGQGPDDARIRALVERDGVVVMGIQRD